MSTVVIMPGGFHPFHAGHADLYQQAKKAFPGADIYVAATNDQSERPFPFAIKEKLAKVAGVAPGHFIQVKSPFQPREITDNFNPEQDVVIFVRSEKDRNESPKPGGTKKDGSPAYFQPWTGKNLQPFGKHAYIDYLDTVEFGPGMKHASQIRTAWPTLNDKRKTAMVMSLYPATQKNPKLAANVVKMLDMGMGMGNELDESWKNAIAGGAMALSALGAGAQTMPNVNAQQVELANKYYNVLVQRAKEDGRELDRRTLNFLKAKAENAAAVKIQQSSTQSQPQPQQGFPTQGSERKVSKDVNNFESKELNEFVPPNSDRGNGGSGDDRSRRIRKLLEIAIQVAKQKNVDELGMIHAMNMIAGDEFFNTAVEGILPDITDKEYMFVLQSAYKTVKQGLAEGDIVPFKQPAKTLTWKQVPKDVLLLANDWLWAEYDNTGLDAVMDPKGFGNGTANELQYITAKLQQKGWTIDHNDANDGPDEYNLILTNKRGQTVLLSIEDAQTFSGWAKGTSSYGLEEGVDPFRSLLIAVRQDAGHYLDTKGRAGGRNFILDINQRLIQLERTGNPRAKIISSTVRDLMDIAQRSSVNTKGVSFGTLAHTLMQLTQQELRKVDTQQDVAEGEEIAEGPIVKRIVHPNKINIYVRQGNKKSPLLVATDIPYKIFDKYVNKAIQKYPQFKQTDFSFKSSDKINEFVTPSGGDDREPDEEILRKLAAMWWNGSIQQMKKAQQTLHSMGWDIGKDQSGDDDAGVFVIRIGDEDGDSYIAFNHSDLDLNEDYLDEN